MNREKVKNNCVGVLIILVALSVVFVITLSLTEYWGSQPKPIIMVIQDVARNTGQIDQCDSSNVTILRDVNTDQISYKCGNLGEKSQIVPIYENQEKN